MRRRKSASLLITLPDYERIFKTIHGMLLSEKSEPETACLFFGIGGAAILAKHHGLRAAPVCGLAAYKVEGTTNVIALGERNGAQITSNKQAFHCWVEADGWILDFAAPLFSDMLFRGGINNECPRRMFQKSLSKGVSAPDDLMAPGDFLCAANPGLTAELIDAFFQVQAYVDLVEICVNWYRRYPLRMKPQKIQNLHGAIQKVELSERALTGSW